MNNLLDPKIITTQQLANIFNNAYMKIDDIENDVIYLNIDSYIIWVSLKPSEERIYLACYSHILPDDQLTPHEDFIHKHINLLNNTLFAKFTFFYHNQKGVLGSEFLYHYKFGLNPAQLVDICYFLQRNAKEALKITSNSLQEQGLLK